MVIFVITTVATIFGAKKVLNAVFRAYVFKVETCEFKPIRTMPLMESKIPTEKAVPQYEEPQKECKIDYNRAKEDVSDGLAMLIIAAPLAAAFFFKTKKFLSMN